MKLTGNTILITGGSTGIGLALAERWIQADNRVLVCGRRRDKLEAAAKSVPGLEIFECDIAKASDRLALHAHAVKNLPQLNVLFNNAGVLRYTQLDDAKAWPISEEEIATNLFSPIHLSMLFAETLAQKPQAAILNTTSGLAHVPMAAAPVYSATKAALHSFTLSQRRQFSAKGIQVIEICPPHVNTDLGIPGTNGAGMDLKQFIDAVWMDLQKNVGEITVGFSTMTSQASRAEKDALFAKINAGGQ